MSGKIVFAFAALAALAVAVSEAQEKATPLKVATILVSFVSRDWQTVDRSGNDHALFRKFDPFF
jgi:hypothetical protein